MGRIIFTLLSFTLLWVSGLSQQYNFTQFSVEDGLPRSGVSALLEDSRGYLWIGTEGGGLAKFDGRNFINYALEDGLPDNTITCVFEDRTGNIWVGTDGHGACRFDGNEFLVFNEEDGLATGFVQVITQGTDGDVWIGTSGGGVTRLSFSEDSTSAIVYDRNSALSSDDVRAMLCDSEGNLWFGTDIGLIKFDGTNWTTYDPVPDRPRRRVFSLFEDRLKNLWVGTPDGVSKMTENGFEFFTEDSGLIQKRVYAIGQDNLGNMWFGTHYGVSRFNGNQFASFTEEHGLSNDRVRSIICDRTGNMWFGTNYGGICRFSGEEFVNYTEKDGLSNDQVLSVIEASNGTIWLGTTRGVTSLMPMVDGTLKVDGNAAGSELKNRGVSAVAEGPNGQIWFGNYTGILIKDGNEVKRFIADGQEFREIVKAIFFEKEGSVWVGSSQGATRFRSTAKGYVFDQYYTYPSINQSQVSCFMQDSKGRIWIGFLKAELAIFDTDQFLFPELPEGLTGIASIKEGPNGNVWVSTEGHGLFKHQLKDGELTASDFQHVGRSEGLSSSDLHQLVFDGQNNLWIGTASGIDQVIFNNENGVKEVNHFGKPEGFLGTETNGNAALQDQRGNLWFGTINGLTRYDPKAKRKTFVENKLHITNVQQEFENVDWSTSEFAQGIEGHFGLPKGLKLPYAFNNLTIEYQAIDLRSPNHIRYQWKLEGYSNDWSRVEAKNSHSFTNLQPGTYTFSVRSVNAQGIWNQDPVEFSFSVIPPFWMRLWFIVLCVLGLVLVVFVIVKLNQRRLVAEKEKLQEKVDERTKELREEKERSDELLLNILPFETAEELKKKGYASVQQYDRVSVLFTDFVGFTNITEGITHEELVKSLDEHFRMFDEVMDKYGIEKIKTIGDAYMAAGGIPTRTITNPLSVVAAGLEMVYRLADLNRTKELKGEKAWQLRLGIHTGSVISGVVGKNKFAFDIWGDAVNTAARMESSGEVMKVNVSGSTYELIKDYFECTPRGKIKAKNKGEIEMFFVDKLKSEFSESENGFVANATFMAIISKDGKKFSMTN